MDSSGIHVLLVDFGSPDDPHDLRELTPFLAAIFGDPMNEIFGRSHTLNHVGGRIMAHLLAGRSRARYASVTYPRPSKTLVTEMSARLSQRLAERAPGRTTVSWAMRYHHPFIDDALADVVAAHHHRTVVVPLFPHESRATVGSIELACHEAKRKQRAEQVTLRFVKAWHGHPSFIAAWTAAIRQALNAFPAAEREKVMLLYSAHAIPLAFTLRYGDPYVEQTRATAVAITHAVGLGNPMALGFQSRLAWRRWTGPESVGVIQQLAAAGTKRCLVIPISFLFEHIETLYDVDRLILPAGRAAGMMQCERVAPPGERPEMIEALTDVALQGAGDWL